MVAPLRRTEHLLALTLVSAAGVALLAVGSTWIANEQERTAELVAHSHEVLTHVSSTRTWVAEVENAYRGFALTGSEALLQSPRDSIEGLHAEVATLKRMTADNPEQQLQLRDLDTALQPFLATGQQIIAARRSAGLEAAQALIGDETRSYQATRLRQVLDALDGEERRLLASRVNLHQTRLYWFWWVLALLVAAVATTLQILYGLARRRQAEQKTLLEAEQRFHILARSVVDYAIFLLDREGHVVSWSAGAEKITGYSAKAILGRHFSVFYPREDVENSKPARELKTAAADGRVEEEGWRLRADRTRYWSNVVITALRDEAGVLTGFGKVTRDLTERKVAEKRLLDEVEERRAIEGRLRDLNDNLERLVSDRTAELTAANVRLTSAREETRALSLRLIAAQEDERRRLSRELHDGIGGALTLIRLQLA
ncbi:MAG TPA: CHASE3 domain-containing protein, partial [Casimicrobiaceae bacterium]|nr:CHASE3 domain-containing protein [Casimicrobiaceae bacterium]